jgi:hypothetical protein
LELNFYLFFMPSPLVSELAALTNTVSSSVGSLVEVGKNDRQLLASARERIASLEAQLGSASDDALVLAQLISLLRDTVAIMATIISPFPTPPAV